MNGHFQLCRDVLFCHFMSASIRLLMCLLLCFVFLSEREERFPALAVPIWMALPKFGADSKADQMEDTKLPLLIVSCRFGVSPQSRGCSKEILSRSPNWSPKNPNFSAASAE